MHSAKEQRDRFRRRKTAEVFQVPRFTVEIAAAENDQALCPAERSQSFYALAVLPGIVALHTRQSRISNLILRS